MPRCWLAVLAALSIASAAFAQDVTPPSGVSFSVVPVVFDAALAPVTMNWCLTVRDDLSGPGAIDFIRLNHDPGSVFFQTSNVPFTPDTSDALSGSACGSIQISQFAPFGPYTFQIRVRDSAGNLGSIRTDGVPAQGDQDLCGIGPCRADNRDTDGQADGDSDGIVDIADNCPNTFNPGQEDADLDLIGDVCDPFPNDRDNDKAQCFADLNDADAALFQAQIDLAVCQAQRVFADTDGDGEDDSTDRCSWTSSGSLVDGDGCSRTQFCSTRASTCLKNDWLNDEPGTAKPRDCFVERDTCR